MKYITKLVALFFMAYSYTTIYGQQVNQSMEKMTYTFEDFSKIKVAGNIHLEVMVSDDYKVEVQTNAKDFLVVEVKNKELYLHYNQPVTKIKKAETNAVVYIKEIKALSAKEKASVNVLSEIKQEQISIDVSGMAQLEGVFSIENLLQIEVSGMAELQGIFTASRINGEVSGMSEVQADFAGDEMSWEISGKSKLESKLNAQKVDLEILGMSKSIMELKASELRCNVSGMSKLTLSGAVDVIKANASGFSKIDVTSLEVGEKYNFSESGFANIIGK